MVVHLLTYAPARGFEKAQHSTQSMQSALQLARASGEMQKQLRTIMLIATANGRFDFATPNLNSMVQVTPKGFQAWLQRAWRDH